MKAIVTQLCLTLYDPMDCSPPGSSVRGILQARILECVAISFSRGSSPPRYQTRVSYIKGGFFLVTAEPPEKPPQSVQSLSRVRLFVTPWAAACQASLSITNSWSLLTLMSMESVMPSNHLILCRPLLLPPSIFPSIRVFSNESALPIRRPEYWSFSISASNEYSGLISFRMDRSDLLSAQVTLKSLLQHLTYIYTYTVHACVHILYICTKAYYKE